MAQPKVSIITSCFKGEKYLEGFFKNIIEQTIFVQCELVFVLNAPDASEIQIIEPFLTQYSDHIIFLPVESVEPLGVSWNRAWQAARGEYLAIWNVDDRRTPDSLARQVKTLDENADCALTYGDYIICPEAGNTHGIYVKTPQFKKSSFLRRFLCGGAFLMWRKTVAKDIGIFDEQFKSALDFDFVIRMVLAGKQLKRTEGLLGYFTDENKGLSTRDGAKLTFIEETVIQWRYAIYDRIKLEYLDLVKMYHIDEIKMNGSSTGIQNLVPGYQKYCQSRRFLWPVGLIRNGIRLVFVKLGIWNAFLKVRAKTLYGAKKV